MNERYEHAVELSCHLHCLAAKSTEVRTLRLPSFSSTALKLKEAVEERFSIPACIQTLSYQTEVLSDSTLLSDKHLRSGDVVDIRFYTRGDCASLEDVIEWLKELKTNFTALKEDGGEEEQDSVDTLVYNGIQTGFDSALGYDLFEWMVPKTVVNRVCFEHKGGLTLLLSLYRNILHFEWSSLTIHQRYLESVCTQAFANFGETAVLRRRLMEEGVLELCFTAMLRVCVPPNAPLVDTVSKDGDQDTNDIILKNELDNALHLLCCFSELPECQIMIATQNKVLEQIVNIALSPSYPCPTAALTAEVFMCLAHTQATHKYLATDYVMDGMLKTLRERPSMVEATPSGELQIVGLRCFTLLLMAILLLESPHTVPLVYLDTVSTHMTEFLQQTSIEQARKYEEERGTIWATLLPYLKLAFLPSAPRTFPDCPQLTELQILSLKFILFFLHSKVSVEMYRTMLAESGLLDFILCLPWHVPESCRPQAISIRGDLCASITSVEPPRLISLGRAILAKSDLGLEKVLKLSVGEIGALFYPN